MQLENVWRKLVYGWKYGGIRLLMSNYPNKESRIMFHRNILNRVRTLAPFLAFDNDPYIVLANQKLYWIIDAYTTSDRFPYSENFTPDLFRSRERGGVSLQDSALTSFYGINYMRNSVKCVVDAYEGSVDDASTAFDNYLQALGDRRYNSASKALETLEKTIELLEKKSAGM